jgi:eukaryotic-like serine/threonine-protein kinase
MQCPVCQAENPSSAITCEKCSTPFPLSEATLDPTGTLDQTEAGQAVHSGGWSVAVTQGTAAETAAKGQLPPGTIVGERYEIQQLLGQGGMGAVYKARDVELERLVALKLIRPDLASHPEILRRFKQELILAREVTHRNVIRIFDLGQARGVRFITMEYVEGRDLRTLLHEKKKLTPEEAVPIFLQITAALEAAHHAGVVHRDLKPQNVMVDKDGRVYVMDFGVARSLETPGMTQTGALMGTPEYMSPEQAKGQKVDARSDLFSLGIIFYETLSGVSPFKAETAMATMYKRIRERAVPVAQATSGVPLFLSDIVSKCLETDVQQRYQSAREIITDLEKWKSGEVRRGMNPLARWWKYAPKQQKWVAAGIAAALLLTAAYPMLSKLPLHFPSKPVAAIQPISLAILPFHNASTDLSIDWLGPSLAEMLNAGVGQSNRLRTVSSDRVHQILKDLRIASNAELDPNMIRRIAELSNADLVVWGQYAKFGDHIRIDATLLDLKRDRRSPLKIEAASEKEIPATVDGLAELIRKNLAVTPDVLKELKASSFQPTSKSVPALRDYNQGVQLLREGKDLEARKQLQASIKEDPEFALAYSKLAQADADLAYDNEAEQLSRKAVDLSQNLPAREKYLIAANHARIIKDYPKAIEYYENLAKVSPGDSDVQFTLGRLYEDTGVYQKAREHFDAVLKTDPQSVETLWRRGAVEIQSSNPQASLDYLNRGLTLSIQLENDEKKALILQAIGIAYKQMNKPEDALRNYQESIVIQRKLDQKRGVAASLNEMAQIYSVLGKPDAALASFKEVVKVYKEIGAQKEAGDTLIDLGNFYQERGQHDQALQMYKESLQIQRDSGDEAYQALCLNNIGNVYLSNGHYDDALTYFQQALGLREKLKVQADIAETLHNLAETNAQMGQYDQALGQYLRALDLYRNAGDKRGAAIDSYGIGMLFGFQGRLGAALNSKQEALKTFRELQDRSPMMAQILSGYGGALAEVGQWDEAQKALNEALSLARELKSEPAVAATLNLQGDSAFYRSDFKSARTLYEQAFQAASRTKDRDKVLDSKIGLAKIAVSEGHSRDVISSLKNLAQEADSLGLKYSSVECSIYAAEALANGKDYARARQELEPALARAEKLGMRTLLARDHYLLGTAFRLTGNGAEATSHYREALRLLDEIRKDTGAEKVIERADLKPIYTESGHWSQAGKS